MDAETKVLVTSLADRVLRLANAVEKLAPDVHDLRVTIEGSLVHELRHEITEIKKLLAVVAKDVDDTEKAALDAKAHAFAAREASQTRIPLPVAKESSGQVAKAVKAVGRLSPETIRALSLLVFAAGLGTGIGFALYKIITAMAGK
jgi:hypothetical protein